MGKTVLKKLSRYLALVIAAILLVTAIDASTFAAAGNAMLNEEVSVVYNENYENYYPGTEALDYIELETVDDDGIMDIMPLSNRFIHFNANDGDLAQGIGMRPIRPDGTVDTMPFNATHAEFRFLGWNTQQTGIGTWVTATTILPGTGDVHVYARWGAPIRFNGVSVGLPTVGGPDNPNSYVARYVLIDIPARSFNTTISLNPAPPNLPAGMVWPNNPPVTEGHMFVNWFNQMAGGNIIGPATLITTETIFHARWQTGIPRTVTFNPGGSNMATGMIESGHSNTRIALDGTSIFASAALNTGVLPNTGWAHGAPSAVRTNQHVAGWYRGEGGTGQRFANAGNSNEAWDWHRSTNIVTGGDITVHARWMSRINFDLNGGAWIHNEGSPVVRTQYYHGVRFVPANMVFNGNAIDFFGNNVTSAPQWQTDFANGPVQFLGWYTHQTNHIPANRWYPGTTLNPHSRTVFARWELGEDVHITFDASPGTFRMPQVAGSGHASSNRPTLSATQSIHRIPANHTFNSASSVRNPNSAQSDRDFRRQALAPDHPIPPGGVDNPNNLVFVGWYPDPDSPPSAPYNLRFNHNAAPGGTTMTTSRTFRARWVDAFRINFDLNGGERIVNALHGHRTSWPASGANNTPNSTANVPYGIANVEDPGFRLIQYQVPLLLAVLVLGLCMK